MPPSVKINTLRLLHRSLRAPAMEQKGIRGQRAIVVAELLLLTSHDARANWNNWLRSSEHACPVHITKGELRNQACVSVLVLPTPSLSQRHQRRGCHPT
jgi:hypothetical protein